MAEVWLSAKGIRVPYPRHSLVGGAMTSIVMNHIPARHSGTLIHAFKTIDEHYDGRDDWDEGHLSLCGTVIRSMWRGGLDQVNCPPCKAALRA